MESLDASLKVNLKEFVDIEMFQEVCNSYYGLFDIPIRIFDRNGSLVVEASAAHAACNYLNTFENGRKSCTDIRTKIKNTAPKEGESNRVDCFCGFRYSIIPIIFQKENLGKVVFGPYMPIELDKIPQEILKIDEQLDTKVFKEKLTGMRRISQSAVKKIFRAMLAVLDVILFSAHKTYITGQMHMSAVRESYRDLAEKNRQLEEMNEKMKEFERLKSNFLATISHELRTPLTSIIGYSDMLSEGIAGTLDEEQQQFINTIRIKGEELLNLISSILDFTKIDTGHLDLQVAEIQPASLIGEVVEKTADLSERRGIKLATDIAEDLPNICVDPKKIQTAIIHLVENAIKFSSPGANVKLSAKVADADETDGDDDGAGFVLMSSPDMLEFAVEDFGVGISEVDQDHIFDPFVQLDSSSTREHDGAGLGLAIVKHYIEAHGGRVHVSSHYDEGSKFIMRLPIFQQS